MEINPILEPIVCPSNKLWYVVSALGDKPNMRVGHTAIHVPGNEGTKGKVYFIGGANPSESFSDLHILDLDSLSWNFISAEGFTARYEHACFIPESSKHEIFVLAGATQEDNIMDVQAFNIQTEAWRSVKTTGNIPLPRTHHSSAAVKDCIYLYSGGKAGAEPLSDRQVYCFNAQSSTWSTLSVSGELPAPRHGHSICAVGTKLVLFGGMASTKYYNDLYILDLESLRWQCPKVKKKHWPSARAAHCAVAFGQQMIIFGGMNKSGMALDDLWKLDLVSLQWTQCTFDGSPPANRLDMASCVIPWTVDTPMTDVRSDDCNPIAKDISEQMAALSTSATDVGHPINDDKTASRKTCNNQATKYLLLIHGGMDTQGEIFDDCMVYNISD